CVRAAPRRPCRPRCHGRPRERSASYQYVLRPRAAESNVRVDTRPRSTPPGATVRPTPDTTRPGSGTRDAVPRAGPWTPWKAGRAVVTRLRCAREGQIGRAHV